MRLTIEEMLLCVLAERVLLLAEGLQSAAEDLDVSAEPFEAGAEAESFENRKAKL